MNISKVQKTWLWLFKWRLINDYFVIDFVTLPEVFGFKMFYRINQTRENRILLH